MYSTMHAYSLCVAACQAVQAQCVSTLYCVSPWLQCECDVVAEDTGTQSPAGEGDEAQLGIIKPSTVSMKGPGCQAGLVSPRQSSLDWVWLHHNLPSLCSQISGKGANLTATRQWNCVWIKSQRHSLTLLLIPQMNNTLPCHSFALFPSHLRSDRHLQW